MGNHTNKIVYLAPDIDLSKNEWWKAHVLGEVKYLQKYYKQVFLIVKNSKRNQLSSEYEAVKVFRLPWFLHLPYFRFWLEASFFTILALILRCCGYSALIERSYRLGGIFSIRFRLAKWAVIYQLNEPIYYESYLMPIQNLLIKIMGKLKITFFWTHESFSYNLPKNQYVNGWRGVDYEKIKKFSGEKKKFDIIYIWSVAKRHSLDQVLAVIKDHPEWKFLFITSWYDHYLWKQKESNNLTNLSILQGLESDKVYPYLYQSKIGIALYEKNTDLLQKFDYCYSPIKVHEYKACWLPVIASNIWNLKSLVKDCGMLINNSKEEIEKSIWILLKNKELYNLYAKNAEKEAQLKYNWDVICKYYFTLLSK